MKLIIRTPAYLEAERTAADHARARADALAYLAATDWMVVRQAETGTTVPPDVLAKRTEARKVLDGR